ncbi:MAG: hypothetical protein NVS2B8_22210 [Vulcanimicrobiaceae bacterium]
MAPHSFETVDYGTYRVVHVRGDVDLGNASALAETIAGANAALPLVVDLSDCSYLDSTGLTVFVRHERQHRGRSAIVAPPNHRSLHLLEITGLALTLNVVPSLDAAIAFCEACTVRSAHAV